MILGIGNDLINIERIENTLTKFGNRFVNRVFTTVEIEKSENLISLIEKINWLKLKIVV